MKPVFHSNDYTFRPTVMADAFGLVGVRRNTPMVREAKVAVNGKPFHVQQAHA